MFNFHKNFHTAFTPNRQNNVFPIYFYLTNCYFLDQANFRLFLNSIWPNF